MGSKVVYEVVPVGNGWEIRLAGNSQTEFASTREEAIARARHLVGRYDEGRVVVRDDIGNIEREITHERTAASERR